MGVPRNSGQRIAINRDGDALLDADEPMPRLDLTFSTSTPQLAWPLADAALVLEATDALAPPDWQPVTGPRVSAGATVHVLDPAAGAQRYYRLRQP